MLRSCQTQFLGCRKGELPRVLLQPALSQIPAFTSILHLLLGLTAIVKHVHWFSFITAPYAACSCLAACKGSSKLTAKARSVFTVIALRGHLFCRLLCPSVPRLWSFSHWISSSGSLVCGTGLERQFISVGIGKCSLVPLISSLPLVWVWGDSVCER